MESTTNKLKEHVKRNDLKSLIMMAMSSHRLFLAGPVKYVSDYIGWICYVTLTWHYFYN